MSNKIKQVVNIEGFNLTNTTGKYWQIARTTTTKIKIVIKGKTTEETFSKFVAKCESIGINYKTDFDSLCPPKANKKQPTTIINIEQAKTSVVTPAEVITINKEVLDANNKIMETTPKLNNVVNPCKNTVSGRTVRDIEIEHSKLSQELCANYCSVKFKELVKLQSELATAMFN